VKKQVRIMLVAEGKGAAESIRRILAKAGVPVLHQVVEGARAAISYLKGEGSYANRKKHPLPGLVLLDLSMPSKSGVEVLRWIRSQSKFNALPIVALVPVPTPSDGAGARGIVGYVRSCLAAATGWQPGSTGQTWRGSPKPASD